MTDVSLEFQVAETSLNVNAASSATGRPRSTSPGHWSERVRDPLGGALKRLKENKLRNLENAIGDELIADVGTLALTAEDPATSRRSAPAGEANLDSASHCLELVSVIEDDATRDQEPATLRLPGLVNSSEDENWKLDERRRFPRRASECMVTLISREQTRDLTPRETDWMLRASRQAGRLLDLSQQGVCLQLDQQISDGVEVLLRISNQQLGRHVDSAATVIQCQTTDDGQFSVHCQTLHDFTLDQLQDLGRPLISTHVLA